MKRTGVNTLRRERRRFLVNNKIRQIGEASNKKWCKKFIDQAQFFNKQKTVLQISCKENVVHILSEHWDILLMWKQHFCDLQAIGSGTEVLKCEKLILNNSEAVKPRTYYYINQII